MNNKNLYSIFSEEDFINCRVEIWDRCDYLDKCHILSDLFKKYIIIKKNVLYVNKVMFSNIDINQYLMTMLRQLVYQKNPKYKLRDYSHVDVVRDVQIMLTVPDDYDI
jgi:hypothetical protein